MAQLSSHLCQLPAEELRELKPRNVAALEKVLPKLAGLFGSPHGSEPDAEVSDDQERRRRAFAALRDLLARLSSRQRLVLAIDDLQWGDEDSAVLIADLLRLPDPPALLLLGCSRTEDEGTSPFWMKLNELLGRAEATVKPCDLFLGPLSPEEAREAALRLAARPGDRIPNGPRS